MTASFFITATDTDAGKTFVATALLRAVTEMGYTTAAVKPLAAGASGNGHNDDALQLQAACSLPLSYEEVNPCCLQQPIAPHIAAQQENIRLSAAELADYCRTVMAKQADLTLIEGAGGWLVPLNDTEYVGDIARHLQVPVILVVGVRLGCLNHALLTAKIMQQDGIKLHGWIANQLDATMPFFKQNVDTLNERIAAPLLATLEWGARNPASAFRLEQFLRN